MRRINIPWYLAVTKQLHLKPTIVRDALGTEIWWLWFYGAFNT